jgi:CpXC protein
LSVLVEHPVPCPGCGTVATRRLAHSINAGRAPQHRVAILAATFQRFTCEQCGLVHTVESEFPYTDEGRRQLFFCHPRDGEPRWRELEAAFAEVVRTQLVEADVEAAREFGRDLTTRLVFGLEALREKILCFDVGLDDRVLEALKLVVLRDADGLPIGPACRPRLSRADEATLTFVAPRSADETVEIGVDRRAVHEIAADTARWRATIEQVDGLYVDTGRILLRG